MYTHTTTTQRAKKPFLQDTAELEVCVLANPDKAKGWSLVSMTKLVHPNLQKPGPTTWRSTRALLAGIAVSNFRNYMLAVEQIHKS